jgi:uncharacterized membrane protein
MALVATIGCRKEPSKASTAPDPVKLDLPKKEVSVKQGEKVSFTLKRSGGVMKNEYEPPFEKIEGLTITIKFDANKDEATGTIEADKSAKVGDHVVKFQSTEDKKPAELPLKVSVQASGTAGSGGDTPLVLSADPATVSLKQGDSLPATVKITRKEGGADGKKAMDIKAEVPEGSGLTIEPAKFEADSTSATLSVKAPTEAKVGKHEVKVTAGGKGTKFTVDVAAPPPPPATLTGAGVKDIKQGESFEVTLTRKDPVTKKEDLKEEEVAVKAPAKITVTPDKPKFAKGDDTLKLTVKAADDAPEGDADVEFKAGATVYTAKFKVLKK